LLYDICPDLHLRFSGSICFSMVSLDAQTQLVLDAFRRNDLILLELPQATTKQKCKSLQLALSLFRKNSRRNPESQERQIAFCRRGGFIRSFQSGYRFHRRHVPRYFRDRHILVRIVCNGIFGTSGVCKRSYFTGILLPRCNFLRNSQSGAYRLRHNFCWSSCKRKPDMVARSLVQRRHHSQTAYLHIHLAFQVFHILS
jgi:hypothetical protein